MGLFPGTLGSGLGIRLSGAKFPHSRAFLHTVIQLQLFHQGVGWAFFVAPSLSTGDGSARSCSALASGPGSTLWVAHSVPSLPRIRLIRDRLRTSLADEPRPALIGLPTPTAAGTGNDVAGRSEIDVMTAVPGAADRSGRRIPDRVVMVLGANERMGNLVKYRVPDLVSRCFKTKKPRQADYLDVVSAAPGLSGSVVELKTPTRKAVSMDESFRQPGNLRQPLPVFPSGLGCNRLEQCVGHPKGLVAGASNQGALGAEPGNDTVTRAGPKGKRNLVVGAIARLERIDVEFHGFFPPTLVSRQKAPRNPVFGSVRTDDQCPPERLPCNVPLDALAKVHEADGVVDRERRECRLVCNHSGINGTLEIGHHLVSNRYGFDPLFRGFSRMIARRAGLLQ